jgi:hypothetical protein
MSDARIEFFLDHHRDGSIDATGTLSPSEVDAADFVPEIDVADGLYTEDLIGPNPLKELAATP